MYFLSIPAGFSVSCANRITSSIRPTCAGKLAEDIVRVLREEVAELLDAGTAIIQFDEPMLTDVVFTGAKAKPASYVGRYRSRAARKLS
jgi:methionine synthase II (cobalamin-independent)